MSQRMSNALWTLFEEWGLRFFIVSYLSYKFGDLFTQFMDKHGSKWFTIVGILIVIIGILIYLIF